MSSPAVGTLILPKIHSAEDLDFVSQAIKESGRNTPLNIVPSIESAKGLWNLGGISGWKAKDAYNNGSMGKLSALLVSLSVLLSSLVRIAYFIR